MTTTRPPMTDLAAVRSAFDGLGLPTTNVHLGRTGEWLSESLEDEIVARAYIGEDHDGAPIVVVVNLWSRRWHKVRTATAGAGLR